MWKYIAQSVIIQRVLENAGDIQNTEWPSTVSPVEYHPLSSDRAPLLERVLALGGGTHRVDELAHWWKDLEKEKAWVLWQLYAEEAERDLTLTLLSSNYLHLCCAHDMTIPQRMLHILQCILGNAKLHPGRLGVAKCADAEWSVCIDADYWCDSASQHIYSLITRSTILCNRKKNPRN